MFNFDDIQTPEGAFTNYFRPCLLRTLFGFIVWNVALNELRNPSLKRAREPKILALYLVHELDIYNTSTKV